MVTKMQHWVGIDHVAVILVHKHFFSFNLIGFVMAPFQNNNN